MSADQTITLPLAPVKAWRDSWRHPERALINLPPVAGEGQ